MKLLRIIDSMRNHLKAVVVACCVALALLMAADTTLRLTRAPAEHGEAVAEAGHAAVGAEAEHGFWTQAYHAAESLPVFWTAFGVLGCLLLVIVSKGILAALVARPEDYYDE